MSNPTVFPKLRGGDETRTRLQDSVDIVLRPIAESLGRTPLMGAPPPRWVNPDLVGGYSQTSAPQPAVAFHQDALGYVHTKLGLTHAAGCVAGTVAFVYPLAYRPSETLTLAAFDANGINSAMQVDASGNFSNLALLAAGDEVRGYLIFRPGT